ncbi:hybrid sensor histidine kinase/response regulator [Hathewaya histolytica]|uniref:hybrid sensor histidine kinase/response regulator n=1 Tax=Hathewaya histolytica TaxID=1498 RepID=UPI003B66C3BA
MKNSTFKKETCNNTNLDVNSCTLRVVHDINNILMPALNAIELIKDKTYKADANISYELNIIELCIKDTVSILNNSKKSVKEIYNKKDIVNIKKIIEDSISITKNKYSQNILVEKQLEKDLNILGDSTELREVFVNIINNAVDCMSGKEVVIKVNSYREQDYIVVKVEDCGLGIDSDNIDKIFTPFFTTKKSKGTGIGLSICKDIIDKHRGEIFVESEKYIGTSFIIKLPVVEKELITNENIEDNYIRDKGLKILVIDDNINIRFIVASLAKKVFNAEVKECTPESAEEEIEKNNYSILISDFLMPINGVKLCNKIKSRFKDIYFCIMTGCVELINDKDKDNVDYILKKPIDIKQLEEMKNEYIKINRLDIKEM